LLDPIDPAAHGRDIPKAHVHFVYAGHFAPGPPPMNLSISFAASCRRNSSLRPEAIRNAPHGASGESRDECAFKEF
jgi:hypothetical protein